MTTVEVTIDGKTLTPEQVTVLRAAVQTFVQMMPKRTVIQCASDARLREINRMLCGEAGE